MVFTFVLPCIFFFHMNVSVVFLYSTVLILWISIPSRDVLFLMMWLLTWKEISFLLHLVSIEVLTSISNNEMYKYTNIIFSVVFLFFLRFYTRHWKRLGYWCNEGLVWIYKPYVGKQIHQSIWMAKVFVFLIFFMQVNWPS